jgi:hypothetical protein
MRWQRVVSLEMGGPVVHASYEVAENIIVNPKFMFLTVLIPYSGSPYSENNFFLHFQAKHPQTEKEKIAAQQA